MLKFVELFMEVFEAFHWIITQIVESHRGFLLIMQFAWMLFGSDAGGIE